MQLSHRQLEITRLVKERQPITGEQIADLLGLSRPTIRADLTVLVMLGYLDAKPKVGYFLGSSAVVSSQALKKMSELTAADIKSMPVIIDEMTTVHDAVITLFLENVGSLIVCQNNYLRGIVSRKDLLKVTLGNASAVSMPISLVMSRQPNIVTALETDTVIEILQKMMHHEIDSVPVVSATSEDELEVIGRISKTTLLKLMLETLMEV